MSPRFFYHLIFLIHIFYLLVITRYCFFLRCFLCWSSYFPSLNYHDHNEESCASRLKTNLVLRKFFKTKENKIIINKLAKKKIHKKKKKHEKLWFDSTHKESGSYYQEIINLAGRFAMEIFVFSCYFSNIICCANV